MMSLHMPFQTAFLNKRPIAMLARESPIIIVDFHMFSQSSLSSVSLTAHLTFEVLLIAMTYHMDLQQMLRISMIAAIVTGVFQSLRMYDSLMIPQAGIAQESLRTEVAFVVILPFTMYGSHVLNLLIVIFKRFWAMRAFIQFNVKMWDFHMVMLGQDIMIHFAANFARVRPRGVGVGMDA
jgi:hypothetical protein